MCVLEWVKRSTLRWFGHIERKGNNKFVKKVYLSSVEGMNRRGRPVRLEDGKIGCKAVMGMMGYEGRDGGLDDGCDHGMAMGG